MRATSDDSLKARSWSKSCGLAAIRVDADVCLFVSSINEKRNISHFFLQKHRLLRLVLTAFEEP